MIAYTLPSLRIVILAAGFSTRLGRPKALATVRGTSLLAGTLGILTPFAAAKIIVVTPPACGRYRVGAHARGVTFVSNPQRASGMSSSVRRGLRQARYSAAVLLLPVDLVELRTRDVALLISRWRGSRRTVVARRLHSAAATPLILPRHLYARALGVTGDQGLRQFVRGLPHGSVSLVDMPSAAADIDTAQDLARARRRRGRWP
jgi:molybdenum cofactor cytidylyltransferase